MIKERLFRNTVGSGLLLGLGSMAATAALLTLGLLIAGMPLGEHLRWYAACFIPYLAFLLKSNRLQPQ